MHVTRIAVALPLASPPLSPPDEFDILLKGGHVLDPKNGVNAVRDMAIRCALKSCIAPDHSKPGTDIVSPKTPTEGKIPLQSSRKYVTASRFAALK